MGWPDHDGKVTGSFMKQIECFQNLLNLIFKMVVSPSIISCISSLKVKKCYEVKKNVTWYIKVFSPINFVAHESPLS